MEKDRAEGRAVVAEVAVKLPKNAEWEVVIAQSMARVALELAAGVEMDGAQMMAALTAFDRPAS